MEASHQAMLEAILHPSSSRQALWEAANFSWFSTGLKQSLVRTQLSRYYFFTTVSGGERHDDGLIGSSTPNLPKPLQLLTPCNKRIPSKTIRHAGLYVPLKSLKKVQMDGSTPQKQVLLLLYTMVPHLGSFWVYPQAVSFGRLSFLPIPCTACRFVAAFPPNFLGICAKDDCTCRMETPVAETCHE